MSVEKLNTCLDKITSAINNEDYVAGTMAISEFVEIYKSSNENVKAKLPVAVVMKAIVTHQYAFEKAQMTVDHNMCELINCNNALEEHFKF